MDLEQDREVTEERLLAEESARAIIAKAGLVTAQLGGPHGLMDYLFPPTGTTKEDTTKRYWDVYDSGYGYNLRSGLPVGLDMINAIRTVGLQKQSGPIMLKVQELNQTFEQICVEKVADAVESGQVPADAALMSTTEFLQGWKNSDGAVLKQINETTQGKVYTAFDELGTLLLPDDGQAQ